MCPTSGSSNVVQDLSLLQSASALSKDGRGYFGRRMYSLQSFCELNTPFSPTSYQNQIIAFKCQEFCVHQANSRRSGRDKSPRSF